MVVLTNQQHEATSVILRGREREKKKTLITTNRPTTTGMHHTNKQRTW